MDTRGIAEFLAAARSGTFTGAARRLGVSVPHVSRQVSRLERRLDTALFSRSTRRMTLTSAGEMLFARCSEFAADFETVLEEVSASTARINGILRIASLTGPFADAVVAPAITQLALEHPNLRIEVDHNSQMTDIVRSGHDISIRSGRLVDSELIATPLATRIMAAAASPEYLRSRGVPRTPDELDGHECIATTQPFWRFSHNGEVREKRIDARLRTSSGAGVVDAAKNGLGIAYISLVGYGEAFAEGSLVPLLTPYWLHETSVHVIRAHRIAPLRVRCAIEALQSHARKVERRETETFAKFLQPETATS